MEAAIGLIGVVMGALLAPVLDWIRQSRQAGQEQRRQLLQAVADFVSAAGDNLTAEWGSSGVARGADPRARKCRLQTSRRNFAERGPRVRRRGRTFRGGKLDSIGH
jgi:hypothetical protein